MYLLNWNGNVSTVKWRSGSDPWQGYNLKYDDAGRLYGAVFGTGDDLTGYPNYYSENVEYDCNGNVTRLRRSGLTDNLHGAFGLVDNLCMTYEGNRLTSVRDSASHLSYANATDFSGVTGQEHPLTYDASGALTSDAGRGMARVDYDLNGNPVRIQFTDGSVTRYIYSAAGEKLRVTHFTAVPNITVPTGTARELAPSEILAADSTDYLLGGSLTMRNGRIDKYQFDEGYCQASKVPSNPAKDKFVFYYYDRDHLGSVRQVIIANGTDKGTVAQRMNYYPSGLQFCDGTTDSDKQMRRYNGKELDKMHGLNTYDYGARQYNPVTARWDRVDPLCEKYYGVSPYAYCGNNPVNAVDPDGREGVKYVDENGNKHIETNVVVLLKKPKEIKESFSEKKKARIREKNERIDRYNASRVEMVKKALDEIYGGKEGVENSHGEKVYFTFNVKGIECDNPRLRKITTASEIGTKHGIKANTPNRIQGSIGYGVALAVVYSQASSGGSVGVATGTLVRVSYAGYFPTSLGHEVGHTFGLKDHPKNKWGSGGLMDYPAGTLTGEEVDRIWENAFER